MIDTANMEALAKLMREAFVNILRSEQYRFECYMTASRWDACCAEGIYEDDGIRAVSMFLEFVETGCVTDDDGEELEA